VSFAKASRGPACAEAQALDRRDCQHGMNSGWIFQGGMLHKSRQTILEYPETGRNPYSCLQAGGRWFETTFAHHSNLSEAKARGRSSSGLRAVGSIRSPGTPIEQETTLRAFPPPSPALRGWSQRSEPSYLLSQLRLLIPCRQAPPINPHP